MKPLRFQPDRHLLTHQLSGQVFDELCSGTVTDEFVKAVTAAQFSKRKLLLRALADYGVEHPRTVGPLTDVESLWEVLAAAEDKDPDVVREILTYPTVGVWAARTLRRIHGHERDALPVWSEFGYLHSLVAAAAIRTRVSCDIRVPVMHGMVTLPTFGQVRLPIAFPTGFVELHTSDGNAVLRTGVGREVVTFQPSTDSRHILRPHRHVSMARGLRLEVEINDTDPYREFSAPMPPRRMDTVQSAEWRKILDEAFDILTLWHPGYARELAAGLRMVTPLSPGGTVKGASSSVAIGAVGAAGTGSATALAETLVHEFQHSKVNGLLNLFDVGGQHVATYAPWRDDPRPLTGLLHGVFAFFSVAEFWRIQRDLVPPHEKPAADFTFALRRHQVIEAVSSLRHHPALTAVGKRLVEAIDARLGPLRLQPIEPELAATIATITDDHRATWRLQHTRPDPQDLVRLSNAWLVAVPAPTVAPSKVVLNSRSRTRSARRDLLLLKATEPDRFAETMRHSAVSSADSAFLTGDYATAAIGYTTLVQTMPHDVDSWIGLGLSMRAQGNAAATAILDSPEVVVALYRKILARTGTGPDLPRLTGWLSSVAVGVE